MYLQTPTRSSTLSAGHGQTGDLRICSQGLSETDNQDPPALGWWEPDSIFTQPASPELGREADTYMTLSNESRDDSEQRQGISFTSTDAEGHGTSTAGPESQENVAPEGQKLTISYTFGSGNPFSSHTVTIYPGFPNELRHTFTVRVPGGEELITIESSISPAERRPSTSRQPRGRIARSQSRTPLAPLCGIGERGGTPPQKRRRLNSVGNDCRSAADTEAQEMSSMGGF